MRWGWLATCVIALGLLATTPAVAQDPKAQARSHFEKGVSLTEQQAWDAALAEFLRSRELFPTRGATKNAAVCLRKLGRYDEALEMLEGLVKDSAGVPPEDRWVLDGEVKELSGLVGRVVVRASESGAAVVVDGRQRGTTPLAEPIRASQGTRIVQLYKEGFIPLELRVNVVGGQTRTVEAPMKPLTSSGRLVVSESGGRPAQLVLDGVVIAKTPYSGLIPPGPHVVALRGEGNLGTQPASTAIKVNETTTLALALEALASEMTIDPTPADATVALDGVVLGHGQWRGRVRSGAHRVEVAQEGFLAATRSVSLQQSESTRVTLTLERDPTSPLWGTQSRSRLAFALEGGPLAGLSFGGPIAGCDSPCQRTLPFGVVGRLRVGLDWASGLGVSLDVGYAGASQHVSDRPASLAELPDGLRQSVGTASDDLALRSLLLGISAGYRPRTTRLVTWAARLGAGAFLGSMEDARSGQFVFNGGAPFSVGPYREVSNMTAAYVAPEARLGLRLGEHFELSAGLLGILLVGFTVPTWEDKNEVVTPTMGLARFGESAMSGKVILFGAPTASLEYHFSL